MSLNPITALSEQLQKLINEHGSAAILRDHLALFKDQVMLLEKENAALTEKVQILQSEKEQHTKDNEELRGKIRKYEQSAQQPSHGNLLEQQKVDILLCLARGEDAEPDEIARALNIGKQVVTFHLEELSEKGMAYVNYIMGGSYWSLDQEGRRYLVRNNLIT